MPSGVLASRIQDEQLNIVLVSSQEQQEWQLKASAVHRSEA